MTTVLLSKTWYYQGEGKKKNSITISRYKYKRHYIVIVDAKNMAFHHDNVQNIVL